MTQLNHTNPKQLLSSFWAFILYNIILYTYQLRDKPINWTLSLYPCPVAAQPICLHPDRDNLIVGKRSVVVGWGKLSTSIARSPKLQYLEVPLTPWETCLKVYGPTGALDSPKSVGKYSSNSQLKILLCFRYEFLLPFGNV